MLYSWASSPPIFCYCLTQEAVSAVKEVRIVYMFIDQMSTTHHNIGDSLVKKYSGINKFHFNTVIK